MSQWADGELCPGIVMPQDAVVPWLSAGKPLTAIAVAQLWEQQLLDLEDPVSTWVQLFSAQGKQDITIRHVLTHTGGFRSLFDLDGNADSAQAAVAKVCASRLARDWVPGQKAAYQPRSGWQILGEIVRVVSGLPVEEYVARHVLLPTEMNHTWMWMTDSVRDTLSDRLTPQLEPLARYCSPGAGTCGTVDDLRRLYEMLLAGGTGAGGQQVLQEATVSALTGRQREGLLDETFGHVVDWGLGLLIDSNQYGADTVPYGYGRHSSHRTFGHGGSQCAAGFADPEHGLAVALVVDGRPGEAAHQVRFRRALTALYEDLELNETSLELGRNNEGI